MSNYIYTANDEYRQIKKNDVIETFNYKEYALAQKNMGKINSIITPKKIEEHRKMQSSYEKCGPNYGNKKCPGNACCSKDGFCGGSKGLYSEWCSEYKGRKLGYGIYNGKYDGVG